MYFYLFTLIIFNLPVFKHKNLLMVMQDFWDQRYLQPEFIYGKKPNQFFKQQLAQLTPGKLLLPAEGEGRNAVYAATQNWDVTAVDYSEKGRQKALKLAEENEVKISYHLGDLGEFNFGSSSYDAAAFIYVHLPRSIIQKVYKNIIQSVKKDGRIIVEVYSVNQLGRDSGGPTDRRVLYTKESLRSLLAGTTIHTLKEVEVELNEGTHHVGEAMVLRAVASRL